MKMFKVVGFRPYSGEYEGRKYSGFYAHCVTDGSDKGVTGERVLELKIKAKHNYVPRIGDQITVIYDEYGIASIEPFEI